MKANSNDICEVISFPILLRKLLISKKDEWLPQFFFMDSYSPFKDPRFQHGLNDGFKVSRQSSLHHSIIWKVANLIKFIVQGQIIEFINLPFDRLKVSQTGLAPSKNSVISWLASSHNWPFNTPPSTTLYLTMPSTSPTYQPNCTTTPGSKKAHSIFCYCQTGTLLPYVSIYLEL